MKLGDMAAVDLHAILDEVANGRLAPHDAARLLQSESPRDLGFAKVDIARASRRGRAEAIFCEGKTPEQIIAVARALLDADQPALLTRIAPEARIAVRDAIRDAETLEDDMARCLLLRRSAPPVRSGVIAILAAGTSDLPVAREAAFTAHAYGSPTNLIADVGVAGIGRLLDRVDEIRKARVVIVVAGMEGALTSVVGGLISAPIVAVPTSIGYGAALGGITPLLTMLTACAPGIAVVNIDNGFGAGYYADVLNEMGDSTAQGH